MLFPPFVEYWCEYAAQSVHKLWLTLQLTHLAGGAGKSQHLEYLCGGKTLSVVPASGFAGPVSLVFWQKNDIPGLGMPLPEFAFRDMTSVNLC
jgi:hypothetical protein